MSLVTELPVDSLVLDHPVHIVVNTARREVGSLLIRARAADESHDWNRSILITLTLTVAIILAGFYSPRNTLLDLIANGEQLYNLNPGVEDVREMVQEVDLAPPPPPEANPEFIKPEERPKIAEAEPLPKPKPIPAPRPQSVSNQFASSQYIAGNKNCPKPPYPFVARKRHYEGTVVVALSIVSGRITSAEVQSSSGYGILDSHAISWLRSRWVFPEGISTNVAVPIQFALSSS